MLPMIRRLVMASLLFATLLAGAPPAAEAQQGLNRTLVFRNNCATPVRLLVRHAEDARYYTTTGFYTVRPNAAITLAERGDNITHITGMALYFFAETPGRTWSSPEVTVAHNGVNYRMVRANQTVSGSSILFSVGCG